MIEQNEDFVRIILGSLYSDRYEVACESAHGLAAASELFRQANLIGRLSNQHRIFVLNKQQSEQLIGKSEHLARRDPVLVMLNSDARVEKRPGTYGIHLCWGDLQTSDAARFLELVAEIAGSSQKSGDQMIAELYQRTSSHAMRITR